jgi:hypothetical protein
VETNVLPCARLRQRVGGRMGAEVRVSSAKSRQLLGRIACRKAVVATAQPELTLAHQTVAAVAIGTPILTSAVRREPGIKCLSLELIATRAVVLVVSVDVAVRRQPVGGIARDELNKIRTLLRAMNL